MGIVGKVRVRCPACGVEQDGELVQSINTRTDPAVKRRLLAGELNALACACGVRTQLAANILFHDPDAEYYCQVVPGDEAAMAEATAAFRAAGAGGTQRLVPSLNALIEKVKILDAGLEDWALEMTKVLLLATTGDLDRVLLFERVDRDARVIHWVMFDGAPRAVASPLDAYDRLLARAHGKPPASELRIDRAWAALAVQAMITSAN
jgi:hypothetical protein